MASSEDAEFLPPPESVCIMSDNFIALEREPTKGDYV